MTKSIMKATVLKILVNFPPFLPLLLRIICRQLNLHSCKESNYRFPIPFLEKNVKADIYPEASWLKECSSRICQHRRLQWLPLQLFSINDDRSAHLLRTSTQLPTLISCCSQTGINRHLIKSIM